MVEKVHQPAPITVAEGPGPKPGTAAGKREPAQPAPGVANSAGGTLPAVKPDPKRALSRKIDVGLGDIHSGKFTTGEARIADGIRNVVGYHTGNDFRATYAEAKRATDEILAAYSGRPPTDVMEVVDGVNNYLQGIVIYGIELARFSRDWSQLDEALDTAKKYVTDAGANSRPPADRLESMINAMTNADVGRPIIDATRKACEEAIRSKR